MLKMVSATLLYMVKFQCLLKVVYWQTYGFTEIQFKEEISQNFEQKVPLIFPEKAGNYFLDF